MATVELDQEQLISEQTGLPARSDGQWPTFRGLTEAEVATHRARGLGNNVTFKTSRTLGEILRENLFTFFNLVLFGLGGVLLLLGSPRDAFFTAAIGFVNALIATVQEVRAKIKLDRIALLARPRAVVRTH